MPTIRYTSPPSGINRYELIVSKTDFVGIERADQIVATGGTGEDAYTYIHGTRRREIELIDILSGKKSYFGSIVQGRVKGIRCRFKPNGKWYDYLVNKFGKRRIEIMIKLAEKNRGLNRYINKNIRGM